MALLATSCWCLHHAGWKGGAHNELIQGMIAELRARKEEAGLQHAQRCARGKGVKIFHKDCFHCLALSSERDSVDVPILALHAADFKRAQP